LALLRAGLALIALGLPFLLALTLTRCLGLALLALLVLSLAFALTGPALVLTL